MFDSLFPQSRPLSPAISEAASSTSGSGSTPASLPPPPSVTVGVCAMDIKARSKAMREILTRLVERANGTIEVKLFGDKVILDEEVENWPRCDILISFFSTDFPLPKAVRYTKLRNPILINDLMSQALLWDRRLVLALLDHYDVPTPKRLIVNKDGGPKIDEELRDKVLKDSGLDLCEATKGMKKISDVKYSKDLEAIIVDGEIMQKPFVEKPVSGEDHNVYIYFRGGGGRRLFRKVGNKSSEYDPNLVHPRTDGSYIYEEFLAVTNAEDIKVYTVGTEYTHAETRKSPTVDGVVRRNTEGKEIRFVTSLTEEERVSARKVCQAFGQRVCGFDVLRCEDRDGKQKSLIIDVNGWSFVKGNDAYYDKAAEILAELCHKIAASPQRQLVSEFVSPMASSWVLKANVTVFRHADRTPKQKLKFSFPVASPWTAPFIALLSPTSPQDEIILRSPNQLRLISAAISAAKGLYPPPTEEELGKLLALEKALYSKIDQPGTKAQLKPALEKGKGSKAKLEKLQLVFKWGGEFTHAARYQSRDLGEQMKKDITIMNKDVLNNVTIYTSSERRVIASAEIFAAALFEGTVNSSQMQDPATRALADGYSTSSSVPSSVSSAAQPSTPQSSTPVTPYLSASPSSASLRPPMTPPYQKRQLSQERPPPAHHLIIRKDLLDDSNAAKDLMDDVKKRLKILLRPGEPAKRPELTWPKGLNKEPVEVVGEVVDLLSSFREIMRKNYATMDVDKIQQRWCCGEEPFLFRERWEKLFEDFVDVKKEKFDPSRVSELYDTIKYCALHHRSFLFAIFDPHGGQGPPPKVPDRRLHELYARAKALFDLVAPQEYGIDPAEKVEIGILTSLPLLKKVVEDLQTARNHGRTLLSLYFTKESHIHTLANLVLLSGLPMATPRIPELDYASHITFELYERNGGRGGTDKEYSIKLSLSEGAHSSNVLDSALDARHALNVQQRRKLTQHLDYSLVIEKLSQHFHRVVPVPGEEPRIEALELPLNDGNDVSGGL